jgi:hypothetical protein
MDSEEPEAVIAVTQLILRMYIIAAPGTNKKAPSFGMINVESVAARPALVYLDVVVTVVDHLPETAFITYHEPPPSHSARSPGIYRISRHRQTLLLFFIMLRNVKVNPAGNCSRQCRLRKTCKVSSLNLDEKRRAENGYVKEWPNSSQATIQFLWNYGTYFCRVLMNDFNIIESRLQIVAQSFCETSERDYLVNDLISEMLKNDSLLL